jgi:DnaK suppressor protein
MSEDLTASPAPNHYGGVHRASDAEGASPAVVIVEGEAAAGGEEVLPSRSPEVAIDEVDRLLDSVEEALAALDDGTYGTCRSCGSAIEPDRLAEDPLMQVCGSCSAGTTLAPD